MNFSVLRTKWVFIPVLIINCAPKVYAPTSAQVPLLEKKGDINAEAHFNSNGFDLQAAYAVFNYLGVGVYGTILNRRDFEDGLRDFQEHRFVGGSLIFFLPKYEIDALFYSGKHALKAEFAVTYGVGFGEELNQFDLLFNDEIRENFASGNYNRLSLQTNLAFQAKHLSIGYVPKLSYIAFRDFEFRATDNIAAEASNAFFSDNRSGWFYEPSFFVKLGGPNVSFTAQIGITRELETVGFDFEQAYGSLGVSLNLNALKRE